MGNKCSCFRKDGDSTFIFETKDSKFGSTMVSKNEFTNSSYVKAAKAKISFMKLDAFDEMEYSDPATLNKLVILQSLARSFIARQFFYKIKSILEQSVEERLEDLTQSFSNLKVKSTNYKPKGYLKFYPDTNKLCPCVINYGTVYFNKLRVYSDDSFYTGEVNLEGRKHGLGKFYAANKDYFEGSWVNDKFTGFGVVIRADGSSEEGSCLLILGNFFNGLLTGKGKRIGSNLEEYFGDFKEGKKDGTGKMVTATYEHQGGYLKDVKEGFGEIKYLDKADSYVGNFKNGIVSGKGKYCWANSETFEGTFLDGKMHGSGTYSWPDGSSYCGEYLDNVKRGSGVFTWANGKTFSGPFEEGKPHGTGLLTVNGQSAKVEFVEGKLSKEKTTPPSKFKKESSKILNNLINNV